MQKEMFFREINNFFLELASSSHQQLTHLESCGYFETLKQHTESITYLFDEMDNALPNFQFQPDYTGGYTNGTILLEFLSLEENASLPKHRYEIQLVNDDRYWGYCQCQPTDEGFDPVHNCCGKDCDWTAPEINITKVEVKPTLTFEGFERDLWTLEKIWLSEANEDEDIRKKERIQQIDEQIEQLLAQKNNLLN